MDARPTFHERLWPGPLGWLAVVGFAVFAAVALVPVDLVAALVTGAVALGAGVAVAIGTSPVVAVRAGDLHAGRAHVAVGLLGEPRVLDADGVREALGPGTDARTYGVVRTWTGGAVLVPLVDPADPTPAWLVSSRRPSALAAAIEAARPETPDATARPGRGVSAGGSADQAAHSEQIG